LGSLNVLGLVRNKPPCRCAIQNCAPSSRRTGEIVAPSPLVEHRHDSGRLVYAGPGDLGDLTLQAMRESGGAAVAVTEEDQVGYASALGEESSLSLRVVTFLLCAV
jgi:hypothetical protein